jgi:hypothetical protein
MSDLPANGTQDSQPGSMSSKSRPTWQWVVAGVIILVLFVMTFRLQHGPVRVVLKTDPQGHAQLLGLPLRNPSVRDCVLKGMNALGFEVRLRTEVPLTTPTQISNLVNTLTAISRSSPARTNVSSAPSPYE